MGDTPELRVIFIVQLIVELKTLEFAGCTVHSRHAPVIYTGY